MEQHEAITLIANGIPRTGGVWADLGAGKGVFTRALAALVGPSGTVYAVDRDEASLGELTRAVAGDRTIATIRTIVGDFTDPLDLPPLDGVILSSALHYVPYDEQPRVLRDVAALLVAGAPLIVVEYDRRDANRWVPYPITFASLKELASDAGLAPPVRLGLQPSYYGGDLYAATLGTAR